MSRTVIQRSIPCAEASQRISLCLLGCETKPPYGPLVHTANMFLELLCEATKQVVDGGTGSTSTSNKCSSYFTIRLFVYNATEEDYPESSSSSDEINPSWDFFDGFLIPGSFSAAYDTDAWIVKLRTVIQNEIVEKKRPTLAVCFGHQVLAHSFGSGKAGKAVGNKHVGRTSLQPTACGKSFMMSSNVGSAATVELFCSHGDQVIGLPDTAVLLASSETVPMEAAVYYSTEDEAKHVEASGNIQAFQPYAVSFQAHPEYGESFQTVECVIAQCATEYSDKELEGILNDAVSTASLVKGNSIDIMVATGRLLGWFTRR